MMSPRAFRYLLTDTGLLLAALMWHGTAAAQEVASANARKEGASGAAQARLESDHQRVVIAPEVLEGWNFLYRFVTEVEFVLCLEGHSEGSKVHVTGFRLARMAGSTPNSVSYQTCEAPNYIGTAHNHPPPDGREPLCFSSFVDQRSFARDQRAAVDVILCGENRYIWTLRDGTAGGPVATPASTAP